MRFRVGLASVLISALAALGCSDVCDESTLDICDVRDVACQREVWRAVQCHRGGGHGPMPQVEIVDPAELQRRYAEHAIATRVDSEWSVALDLLGLIDAGTTFEEAMADALSDQYAALYSASEDRIAMGVPPEGLDPAEGVFVLAHEMVHAHQHRRHDIEIWERHVPRSLDGRTAIVALIEGEAILDSNILIARAHGFDPAALEWDDYFGTWADETRTKVASAPSRFPVAVGLLPYPVGGWFVLDTYRHLDLAHVRALWDAPPPSFAHWLRAVPTPDTFGMYDAAAPLACGLPPAPDGLERLGTDSFGAAVIFAWLVGFLEIPAAWDGAAGATGDRITVYGVEGGAGPVAFAWRLRGVPVARAAALHGATEGLPWRVTESRGELLIVGSNDPVLLADWTSTDECPPPEPLPTPLDLDMPMGLPPSMGASLAAVLR